MIFDLYRTERSLRKFLVVLACMLCAVPAISNAETTVLSIEGYTGARVPWKMKRMTLKSENKDVGDLLRQLASSNELAIQVDDRIKGAVSGTFSLDPQSILELLSKTYGFFWFFDGSSIIVSPVSDVKIEMLRLAPDALSNLTSTLQRLGVYDMRYPIRVDAANRLVVLSGPSRYVDMLSNVSRALQDSAEQKAPTEVLVYPLKYAWADDRTMASGTGSITIPGVVSVLRNIYRQGDERTSINSSTNITKPRAKRSLSSGGADRNRYGFYDKVSDEPQTTSIKETVNQVIRAAGAGGEGASGLPVIVADGRRNAVVVRDLAERMPKHKALIQELDTRSQLVEIEAKIIDVRSEAVESLGVDWRLATRRADLQSGSGDSTAATPRFSASLAKDPVDSGNPQGGRFTVMMGSAAQFLMTRINALEQAGKARTVGTPRVTTLDNVQSVMSSKEVFYVKVPGAYASDLFEVSAGVSLTVLPFVIREDGSASVRIAVTITDGSVDKNNRVDGIPSTTQSEINAEAIIKEGASLLVAGYVREEESSGKSGIPILSRLPGVGALFGQTSTNSVRQERFFLLTPRIIEQ